MKTTRKVWVFWGVLLLTLVAIYLWLFALTSTAHASARAALVKSAEVVEAVGAVSHVVPVGVRQRFPGHAGISCTRATYVVVGDAGVSFAVVQLKLPPRARDWSLEGLSLCWFGKTPGSC